MTTPTLVPEQPKSERRHRSKHGIGLFVTDGEWIELLGVPKDTAAPVMAMLDKEPGFPKKQALWGNRRWRPALEQWFESRYGIRVQTPTVNRERLNAIR